MTSKLLEAPMVGDYEYNDKLLIPPDLYVGIRWTCSRGHKYETRISQGEFMDGKRVARLRCSSFAGSIGAMHTYGKIEVHGPMCHDLTENQTYSMAGYGLEYPRDHIDRLIISVTRRLTKVESDMNGDPLGGIGEFVNQFYTEAEVRDRAPVTFGQKFAPGWVLIDEDTNDVIATT